MKSSKPDSADKSHESDEEINIVGTEPKGEEGRSDTHEENEGDKRVKVGAVAVNKDDKVAVKISKRTSLVEKLRKSVAPPDCEFAMTNCVQDLVSCVMKSKRLIRIIHWFRNDIKFSFLVFHPMHIYLLTVNNSFVPW